MRAWILEKQANIEKRPLKLVDIPEPHAINSQIRLKIISCGICRTDIHIAEGDLPLKKIPLVLGHEVVGVVDEAGEKVKRFKTGDKVGISWLNSACGKCKYCLSGQENYCHDFICTGWDVNGGFAEYITIKEDFALSLKGVDMEAEDIAPLLCPGVAGYCVFKLTGAKRGDRLGLYGFGPTAFYVLKIAASVGVDVYVSTRSLHHIKEAEENGALWAGNALEKKMPHMLNSAIVFPPAGPLVETALSQIEIGGVLVLAPVSMSIIGIKDYSKNLWGRDIRTLYNVNKSDGEEFLEIAGRIGIKMDKQVFSFEQLQDAMILIKNGEIKEPNAVITV